MKSSVAVLALLAASPALAQQFKFFVGTTGEKACGLDLALNGQLSRASVFVGPLSWVKAGAPMGDFGHFDSNAWNGFRGATVSGNTVSFRTPMMFDAVGAYRSFTGPAIFTKVWEFGLTVVMNEKGPVSSTVAWRPLGFKEGHGVTGWRQPVHCYFQN